MKVDFVCCESWEHQDSVIGVLWVIWSFCSIFFFYCMEITFPYNKKYIVEGLENLRKLKYIHVN